MAGSNKNTCVLVGVGCFGLVVLAAIGVSVYIYQAGKNFAQTLKNPGEAGLAILGAEALPPGFHANVAIKTPFDLMNIAIVSNQQPVISEDDFDGNVGNDGFIFFELIRMDPNEIQEIKGFLSGEIADDRVLRRNNIDLDFDSSEVLNRGEISHGSGVIPFATLRSGINSQHTETEGISTIMVIECPDDQRFRLGVRFGPDPDTSAPNESLDLTGSANDPVQLERFMGFFRFCDEE